jgi:hypothetical protein
LRNGFRWLLAIPVVLVLGFTTCMSGQILERVDADEITVIQSPVKGDLSWYTTPGLKVQMFGKVTTYKKRSIYPFQVKMRFNDGAHGNMAGSIQYEMPTDEPNLTAIHVRFGSQEAVQQQMVEPIVRKSIYMTGPLMSSKESYAERRNALISYVEDQVANGVYRTRQKEERIEDPITGEKRTVTVVEIVEVNGMPLRQEEAVLTEFGVKPFNFAIDTLDYEEKVEAQIAAQQQATMDVQTAIAEAKKAEQRALTVEQQGRAQAMASKWEQETEKARRVTEAEQQKEVAKLEAEKLLEVAKLDAESAEQYRIATLRRAEADAGYKKQVMTADGALQQKLEAWTKAQQVWANAFAQRRVPSMVMAGNGGGGPDSDVNDFMSLMTANAAKQLALDFKVQEQ